MSNGQLILWNRQDTFVVLTLNRPEVKNAMDIPLLNELNHLLDQCENEKGLRSLVIQGAGGCFASGADIAGLRRGGVEGARAFHKLREETLSKLENLPIPTLALVDGYALGSGLELALSCDIRWGTPRAKFGVPSGRLGIVESYEYVNRLTRVVGASWAKELLFTGAMLDAQNAFDLRIINRIVPKDELDDSVKEFLGRIAANSPTAVNGSKKVVNFCQEDPTLQNAGPTSAPFLESIGGKDFQEGTLAFLEKRPPKFNL